MFSLHFSFDFSSKYLSYPLYLNFFVSQEVTKWFFVSFSSCICFRTLVFSQKDNPPLFPRKYVCFSAYFMLCFLL